MEFYKASVTDELTLTNQAIAYYMEWAEEFRSTEHDWDFVTYYYRGLLDETNTAGIRFRALFFAARLQPVLEYVHNFVEEHKRPPHILDLGCGLGLESLLLALTGAKVHGIDSWKPMVAHASKRKARYQHSHRLTLDLEYDRVNLFEFSPPNPYDSVYTGATLHHIEPAREAFQAITRLIKPGGRLFLSEENGYSPIQQLAVQKKIGWTQPRKRWGIDEETGEKYLYGNENIRPAFLWARYMRQAGLQPDSIKYCRFLPPLDWPVERLVRAERRLRNIPVIAQLGAIGFLLTAHKPPTTS